MSGGSSKQTVGYKYHLGAHLVVGHGPFDAILEVQVDKRTAWEGFLEGSGSITIDAPELFGGDQREGGVTGDVDVMMGLPSQGANPYLVSKLGSDLPAYRGVVSFVLNQVYVGNNPYLKPWAFLATRTNVTTNGDQQWNLGAATIDRGEGECNPACDPLQTLLEAPADATWVRDSYVAPEAFFPAGGLSLQSGNGSPQTDFVLDSEKGGFWTEAFASCDGIERPWIYQVSSDLGTKSLVPTAGDAPGAHDVNLALIVTGLNVGAPSYGDMLFHQSKNLCRQSNGNVVISQTNTVIARIETEQSPPGSGIWRSRLVLDFGRSFFNYTTNATWTGSTTADGLPSGKFATDWQTLNDASTPAGYLWAYITVRIKRDEAPQKGFIEPASGISQWAIPISAQFCCAYRGGPFEVIHTINVSGNYHTDFPDSAIGIYDGDQFVTLEDSPSLIIHEGSARIGFGLFQVNAGVARTLTCEPLVTLFDPSCCGDMNPAHIIRECLTDSVWGLGYQEADIDETSFTDAASALLAESLGISIIWEREQPIEDFISEILRHIDGVLYVSRSTGKFVLKLIRDDVDSNTLTLDESNILAVDNVKRPTISELTNSVSVVYWDSGTDESAAVTLHNEALRQIQGAEVGTSIQYPGITTRENAARLAARDLKALSTPLLSAEITANREAAELNVGDAFVFSWPDLSIGSVVMRVNEISYGDGQQNAVTLSALQDVFSAPDVAPVAGQASQWVDPTTIPPEPATARVVQEAPYYLLVTQLGENQTNQLLVDDPDSGYLMVSAGRPSNEINGEVFVNSQQQAPLDFHPYGTLFDSVSETETYIELSEFADANSLSFPALGQIDDEIIRVDALEQDSTGARFLAVGRGVLDTVPAPHDQGSLVAVWGDFATTDETQYAAGEEIDAAIQTNSTSSVLALADAPSDEVRFDSRAIRPYPVGDLRIDGLSYPAPYTWTASHTLTWTHRDRTQQTDGNLYDHTTGDIGPEAGVDYIVEGIAIIGDSLGDSLQDGTGFTAQREKFLEVNVAQDTEYVFDIDSGTFDSNYSEPPEGTQAVLLRVVTRRDGYDSWQAPTVRLQFPGFTDSLGVPFDSTVFDSIGDSNAPFDSIGDSNNAGGGGSSDPDFASVVLLLSCDGTDGSTTFTDDSTLANAITVFGNAQIDTAQSKFGGSAALFDGNTDKISTPDNSDFNFGGGDWTIEFFMRLNGSPLGTTNWLVSSDLQSPYLWYNVNSSGKLNGRPHLSSDTTGTTVLAGDTWYHLAFVRNGSSFKVYIDGVEDTGLTRTVSYTLTGSRGYVFGGTATGIASTASFFDGWIDEIRITKGVARYTSAFTPPTAPFPKS